MLAPEFPGKLHKLIAPRKRCKSCRKVRMTFAPPRARVLAAYSTPNARNREHAMHGRSWRGLEPPTHLQISSPLRLERASGSIRNSFRRDGTGSWAETCPRLESSLLLQSRRKKKMPRELEPPGHFSAIWPGSNLLSRANAHYHRRKPVSRSCSGWEGVGPGCYGRQIDSGLAPRAGFPAFGTSRDPVEVKIGVRLRQARYKPLAVLTVIGSSHTGN